MRNLLSWLFYIPGVIIFGGAVLYSAYLSFIVVFDVLPAWAAYLSFKNNKEVLLPPFWFVNEKTKTDFISENMSII